MNATSSTTARTLTSLLLGMTLALALVLVGPATPPASAFQAPMPLPQPVHFPASAYPTTGIANANDLNRTLKMNPTGYVAGQGQSAMQKAGKAFAVIGGIGTVYSLSVNHAAELTGSTTSGDLMCDLSILIANSNCGIRGAPGYVPNSGIVPTQSGWVGRQQTVTGLSSGRWSDATVTVNFDTVPVFGATARHSMVWTTTVSGHCDPSGAAGGGPGLVLSNIGKRSNGVLSGVGSTSMGVLPSSCTTPGTTRTMEVAASSTYAYDHTTVKIGETILTWFPEGHEEHEVGLNSNPWRHWRTSWECSDGTSGSKTSALFQETDSTYPPMPQAACVSGLISSWIIEQITSGLDAPELIQSWTAPPELVDWLDRVPPGTEKEPLDIARVKPDGSTESCFQNRVACQGWPEAPPETFRCTQGTVVYDLSECVMYVPTFEPHNPPVGIHYYPPHGPEVPKPVPPIAAPSPVPDTTTNGGQCFPQGWNALNPVEWVLKPVQCALSWAFVPSSSTIAKLEGIQTLVATRTPIPELGSIFGWLEPPSLSGQCGEFGMKIWFIEDRITALDTCDPADPIMKALAPIRPVLSIAVWVGTFAPLAWWAWREYAPGAKGVA